MALLTRLMTGGMMTAALVLGAVGQADAANIIRSWEAIEADRSSESRYGGGHAFWLPELVSGGKFVFDSTAIFNEFDDGTAHFTGSIVAANDADKQWDFDLWFDSSSEGSGGPKRELNSSAYVENGGTIDTDTWSYYNFSSTRDSVLTADAGTFAGQSLSLSDFTNGRYPLQIGLGASGKNLDFGLSTWFAYEGDQSSTRHADINVNLVAQTVPPEAVPEPSMGLISLAVAGVAAKKGLKRNKQ